MDTFIFITPVKSLKFTVHTCEYGILQPGDTISARMIHLLISKFSLSVFFFPSPSYLRNYYPCSRKKKPNIPKKDIGLKNCSRHEFCLTWNHVRFAWTKPWKNYLSKRNPKLSMVKWKALSFVISVSLQLC